MQAIVRIDANQVPVEGRMVELRKRHSILNHGLPK